jgi:hypothetical protein
MTALPFRAPKPGICRDSRNTEMQTKAIRFVEQTADTFVMDPIGEVEIDSGSCDGNEDHASCQENIPLANDGHSTVPKKSGVYTEA